MTRELAILGIPTISVYQDDLLEVDKFLLEENLMMHEPNLKPDRLRHFLSSLEFYSRLAAKRSPLFFQALH